ncbi:chemotaxis protein CheW [Simiduia agarivorans]|uniref:Flagellar hook-basal body complex protein FliE n=1 Tax=Simiduia agarivorans (strain DSM 21679 / JCM 13881 / BCRC 17597 / SA1) TaxID=1117647 RepID=K4KF90_SIMAS|nr:chemotaxis protein CheW [Simiduia agarivorans]AFU97714.1 flagellar hook-basal body complex protein FliE [Simiduia agarivorans SA1 = DSM 21679]
MSLNNPQDSVCDYLAELLYDAEDVPLETGPDRNSRESPQAGSVETDSDTKPVTQAKPVVRETREPDLAESDAVDREKLNRLLNSAQFARTALASEVKAAPLTTVNPPAAQEPVDKVIETPDEDTQLLVEPHEQAVLQWCENGRPQWAQERFDVLLFKVYGLTLAVPLIALGQIQPIDEQLTPLFGQADWFMGIQPTPMGKIKTVNTALFVMPERYNKAFLDTAKYVISIHGVPWGLAVDSVEQPKTLSPEDVKWRSGRTQRPWLAGTVKEYMCALIDIPNMAELLNASDKNSRKPRL